MPAMSLSARRAWIEIKVRYPWTPLTSSLSARRAWIEMLMWYQCNTVVKVALRKESVDRNPNPLNFCAIC